MTFQLQVFLAAVGQTGHGPLFWEYTQLRGCQEALVSILGSADSFVQDGPRDRARGDALGIHTLRHSWASRMMEAGADPTLLMTLGGWSSLTMVQRYSHYRPERAVDATARMLAAREAARDLQISPRRISRAPRDA